MPNLVRPTLAQKFRKCRSELKIIFISRYAWEAFKKHPVEPAGVAILPKPISVG